MTTFRSAVFTEIFAFGEITASKTGRGSNRRHSVDGNRVELDEVVWVRTYQVLGSAKMAPQ